MRFITEFEREVVSIPDAEFISNFPHVSKMRGEAELGQIISESFGWKENTVKMYGGKEMNRWALEIEAFPMDKWVEFKSNLYEYLNRIGVNPKVIKDRFDELESFGKPETKEA